MSAKLRPSSVRQTLCGGSPVPINHLCSIARATAASAAAVSKPIDWAIGATIRYCTGRPPVTRSSSTHSARARLKAWDVLAINRRALWHRGYPRKGAMPSHAATPRCDRHPPNPADHQRWCRRMSPSRCGCRSQSRRWCRRLAVLSVSRSGFRIRGGPVGRLPRRAASAELAWSKPILVPHQRHAGHSVVTSAKPPLRWELGRGPPVATQSENTGGRNGSCRSAVVVGYSRSHSLADVGARLAALGLFEPTRTYATAHEWHLLFSWTDRSGPSRRLFPGALVKNAP